MTWRMALSLGIKGAGIANSGNATVNNTGDISMRSASSGFIAQSVGGGRIARQAITIKCI